MADTDFPVVEHIQMAASKEAIAQILLRLPDAVVLSHHSVLAAECRRSRFPEGASFLTMRVVAMDAMRDSTGRLPDGAAAPLETWRKHFAAFAKGSSL